MEKYLGFDYRFKSSPPSSKSKKGKEQLEIINEMLRVFECEFKINYAPLMDEILECNFPRINVYLDYDYKITECIPENFSHELLVKIKEFNKKVNAPYSELITCP